MKDFLDCVSVRERVYVRACVCLGYIYSEQEKNPAFWLAE